MSGRPSAARRGYGRRWRAAAAEFLRERPFCLACERMGLVTPATAVDHVVPHRGDQSLFWSQQNWAPLCKRCHDAKTARESQHFGATRIVIVAGPSGPARRQWVQSQAHPGDIVIDRQRLLEAIAAAGTPTAHADAFTPFLAAATDALLTAARRSNRVPTLYSLGPWPLRRQREELARRWDAQIVVVLSDERSSDWDAQYQPRDGDIVVDTSASAASAHHF